jgi:cysteinyl-tRNA synthetase
VTALISQLVQQREEARQNNEWTTADQLRDQLRGMGVTLHDKEKVWRSNTGACGIIPAWSSRGRSSLLTATIVMMVQCREAARKEKDWARADQIRDELKSNGVQVFDKEGIWKAQDGRSETIQGAGRGGVGVSMQQYQYSQQAQPTASFPQYQQQNAYLQPQQNANPYAALAYGGAMYAPFAATANSSAMPAMPATPSMPLVANQPLPSASTADEINALVEQRERCRARKDFRGADQIRDHLGQLGIQLMDKEKRWIRSSDGTSGAIPMFSTFLR